MTENIFNKALLFVSKESLFSQQAVDEFKAIVKKLGEEQAVKSEVIDVFEKPDMAEEYKIEVLPTIIVDEKRFVGEPKAEEILKYLKAA
jgi:hypothetical protein